MTHKTMVILVLAPDNASENPSLWPADTDKCTLIRGLFNNAFTTTQNITQRRLVGYS